MWQDTLFGMNQMDSQQTDGVLSTSLKSLQLQLVALFEGVGGGKAVHLLDTLSNFTEAEQAKIIEKFINVLQKVSTTTSREQESGEVDFTNNLENELVSEITKALMTNGGSTALHAHNPFADEDRFRRNSLRKRAQLSLVRNDEPSESKVIDLASIRQRRN